MEAPNYSVDDLWLYTESRKAVPETAEMRSGAAFFMPAGQQEFSFLSMCHERAARPGGQKQRPPSIFIFCLAK